MAYFKFKATSRLQILKTTLFSGRNNIPSNQKLNIGFFLSITVTLFFFVEMLFCFFFLCLQPMDQTDRLRIFAESKNRFQKINSQKRNPQAMITHKKNETKTNEKKNQTIQKTKQKMTKKRMCI